MLYPMSADTQITYLNKKISDPACNYELVNIYVDNGKHGCIRDRKSEFYRMLDAGRNGEFDIIYCMSYTALSSQFMTKSLIEEAFSQREKHEFDFIFELEGFDTRNNEWELPLCFHETILGEVAQIVKSIKKVVESKEQVEMVVCDTGRKLISFANSHYNFSLENSKEDNEENEDS